MKLINLVESQPCLYDAASPGYTDPKNVQRVWSNIAHIMGRMDMDGESDMGGDPAYL